jgi:hypothetical protein
MANSGNLRPEQTDKRSRRSHTRKQTVTLGAGILLFAAILICIAVFFIVKSAIGFVKDYVGQDETASYFESYLEPVVMFDPDTFDDISAADARWKLETAIWAALDENEKNGSYATTSDGREILPVKDVASYIEKYFGDAANPGYETFADGNFTYEYSEKEQCYYIPLTAVTDYYMPSVTNIKKSFNTVSLTVAYIPCKNWGQDNSGDAQRTDPDKTMTIVLTGSRGSYAIKSIKDGWQSDTSSHAYSD